MMMFYVFLWGHNGPIHVRQIQAAFEKRILDKLTQVWHVEISITNLSKM